MSKYFNDDILNEYGSTYVSPAIMDGIRETNKKRFQNIINTSTDPAKRADALKKLQKITDYEYKMDSTKRKNAETNKQNEANRKAELKRQDMSGELRPITPEQREIANRPENKDRDIEKEMNDIKTGSQQGEVKPHTPNQYHANNPAPYLDAYTKHNLKVAGGVAAGAAAAIGIGAIISNILKKRKWKMDGCKNIEDSSKRQQCKDYIVKKNMSDIKSQCKFSNNPEKCKRIAMEKLRDI